MGFSFGCGWCEVSGHIMRCRSDFWSLGNLWLPWVGAVLLGWQCHPSHGVWFSGEMVGTAGAAVPQVARANPSTGFQLEWRHCVGFCIQCNTGNKVSPELLVGLPASSCMLIQVLAACPKLAIWFVFLKTPSFLGVSLSICSELFQDLKAQVTLTATPVNLIQ